MYINILIGVIGLFFGGEVMVRGAVSLASRLKLSPMLIGLTVLALATSLPELVVSMRSVLMGLPGIAIGNAVGSNITNSLLVLGAVSALYPVLTNKETLFRDGGMLLITTCVFVVISLLIGSLGMMTGIFMLFLLGAYLRISYKHGKIEGAAEEVEELIVKSNLGVALILVLVGFGLLYFSANIFVDGAADLARSFGISEAVIGLTIVALGTSLPELVASVVAAFRKHTEMALGNVIGSNIFNILLIMGSTSIVKPYPIDAEVINRDMWVLLGATLLMGAFAYHKGKISRFEGALLLCAYVIYLVQFGI